ncbi:MAG: DUF1934 domain-containing protein [Lachnospiraceae bacterium]|nr:DUF1934 domain-containing protein [Lachnospiraceae bacterium]
MKKEVLVSVSGLQYDVGSEDSIEVVSPGKYYLKNGKHYVIYNDDSANDGDSVRVRLIVTENRVDMDMAGARNTGMTFEKGRNHVSMYGTEYGNVRLGIYTSYLHVDVREDGMYICIKYALEINYEKVSDCKIVIRVDGK